jgi:hypothetical protein
MVVSPYGDDNNDFTIGSNDGTLVMYKLDTDFDKF